MNCCKEYAQTISEYLDGALGENERAQLLEAADRYRALAMEMLKEEEP